MANNCRPQIQACAFRFARLYPTGVPEQGVSNLYTTDQVVTLGWSAEKKAGTEFEVENACGVPCVSHKGDDVYKWLNVTMQICTPDPELMELVVGGATITNGADVGWQFPALNTAPNPDGVSMEVWAKRIVAGGGLDPDAPYAWYVFPRVRWFLDEATFENGPYTPTFSGIAEENSQFYNGPENDWPKPLQSGRAMQWLPTDFLPDNLGCGYEVLVAS